jgi:hypothetical protein
MTDKLWEKYGLSTEMAYKLMSHYAYLYTIEEVYEYYNLVRICHDLVASWWDKNGRCPYYDALKAASPEIYARASEWSRNHLRKINDYAELTKNWSHKYLGNGRLS